MNKIAETTSHTALPTIQPAASFAEIGDGRKLAVDGARGVPARVQRIASFLRAVFVFETCVDVANEMIIIVITYNHLLNLPKLAHLAPEILIESIEMVLKLARIHLVLWVVRRVLVQVRQEDGLRVRRFDVFSRAAVAVPAGADLVVERAIYFVGFGAEDGREVVRHGEGLLVAEGGVVWSWVLEAGLWLRRRQSVRV